VVTDLLVKQDSDSVDVVTLRPKNNLSALATLEFKITDRNDIDSPSEYPFHKTAGF